MNDILHPIEIARSYLLDFSEDVEDGEDVEADKIYDDAKDHGDDWWRAVIHHDPDIREHIMLVAIELCPCSLSRLIAHSTDKERSGTDAMDGERNELERAIRIASKQSKAYYCFLLDKHLDEARDNYWQWAASYYAEERAERLENDRDRAVENWLFREQGA